MGFFFGGCGAIKEVRCGSECKWPWLYQENETNSYNWSSVIVGWHCYWIPGPSRNVLFYLFSEGGRFNYEGLGFGSFTFGNIASQIIGYYLIAAMLIVVGYGHLKLRRWARRLSLALLRFWIVAGGAIIVVIFFMLSVTKELSFAVAVFTLIIVGLSYFVFPWLLIRFYNSQKSKEIFSAKDDKHYWTDNILPQLMALSFLYFF